MADKSSWLTKRGAPCEIASAFESVRGAPESKLRDVVVGAQVDVGSRWWGGTSFRETGRRGRLSGPPPIAPKLARLRRARALRREQFDKVAVGVEAGGDSPEVRVAGSAPVSTMCGRATRCRRRRKRETAALAIPRSSSTSSVVGRPLILGSARVGRTTNQRICAPGSRERGRGS